MDYEIETVRDREPTGFHFGVQIKGRQHVVTRKGVLRLTMEQKPLKYYRDDARLPIFILLVDVENRNAYWLFAQRYLRQNAESARLNRRKTLTLKFDAKDCLCDSGRFERALAKAEEFMRELYPGSPRAAVEQRRRMLQSLDPTIALNVSFVDGREIVTLRPTQPLSLTFRGQEKEITNAFQGLMTGGDAVRCEADLVCAGQSPLFSKLMPTGRYQLRLEGQRRVGSVHLSWGESQSQFIQVDGFWQGGTERTRFRGALHATPLSIEVDVTRGAQPTDMQFGVSISLNFKQWEGQLTCGLPWFDPVRSLIAALGSNKPVTLTCFFEGLRVGAGVLTATANAVNARTAQKFDWLARVRDIAMKYAPETLLPKLTEISYEQERQMDALWALSRGDSFADDISEATFSFTVRCEAPLPESWASGAATAGSLKISGTSSFDFFGHSIELPDVENIFSSVRLISVDDLTPPSKRLTFRAANGAKWIRRKARPEPSGPSV